MFLMPGKPFQGQRMTWTVNIAMPVRMLCFPSGQQIVILFCRRALIKCRRTEEETIEINVWSHTCRRLLPPNLWPKTYTMQSRQSQQNTAPDDDSGVLVFIIYPTKVNEKKRLTLIAPSPFFLQQSVCDLLYFQLEEEPTKTPNMVK